MRFIRISRIKLIGFLILVCSWSACTSPSNKESFEFPKNVFPLHDPKELNSKLDTLGKIHLDSMMRLKWSDKIMGRQFFYSSTYLADFSDHSNYKLFALYTFADDWSKIFLLSTQQDGELIDFLNVTDSYGDARTEADETETVTEFEMKSTFENDSILVRTSVLRMIYKYSEPSQYIQIDSIVEKISVSSAGKFQVIKKDSSRLEH